MPKNACDLVVSLFASLVLVSGGAVKLQAPQRLGATQGEQASALIRRGRAAAAEGVTTGDGCASASEVETGTPLNRTLRWEEDGLPGVDRTYSVYVPESYRPGTPTGLVVVFHGWGDPSTEMLAGMGDWPMPYHSYYGYGKAADSSGFITVYPKGLADCKGHDCHHEGSALGYESWNGVGTTRSHGSMSVCDTNVTKQDYCYKSTSARKSGHCHRCDWTTGYNDVGFIQKLVSELKSSFCVDEKRVFATGCSNGGMFVHELAQHMSETFAAVAANCAGKPHMGFEAMPEGRPVSMMLVTGEKDRTIRGFENSVEQDWWDGFKFASREEVIEAYRVRNKCPSSMTKKNYSFMNAVHAPSSVDKDRERERKAVTFIEKGTGRQLETWEADYSHHSMSCSQMFYGCAGNTSLVSCEWAGGHDIMKGEPSFAYTFFANHPRH